MLAVALFLALFAIYAVAVAELVKRRGLGGTENPEVPEIRAGQERAHAVVERVYAARGAVVHPSSYGGDFIEYPLLDDFDAADVIATRMDIEAL